MASSNGSSDAAVEKIFKKLAAELEAQYASTQGILRQGDRLIIPERMSYDDAINALGEHKKRMEQEVETQELFDTHPDDALYALFVTIRANFGALLGEELDMGFWGKIPGQHRMISISATEQVNVPVGHAAINGLPITMDILPYEDKDVPTGGGLRVDFTYKRKLEPLVKRIIKDTREYIRDHSIFAGQAIDSEFHFINLSNFDASKIVYNEIEEMRIDAEIMEPIRNTSYWRRQKLSLKRGALLSGRYGTGKSLTALHIAQTCNQHGWTFVRALVNANIEQVLKFAQRKNNQPCVVFIEDIDGEASGEERDTKINGILDVMDGILNKSDEVMVVMTTNHSDRIQPAMLRPGRIDTYIEMGDQTAETVKRLIANLCMDEETGESLIEGELDGEKLFAAAEGYTPAFIVEAAKRVRLYAAARAHREGRKVVRKFTSEDVENSLRGLRAQYALMNRTHEDEGKDVDNAVHVIVEHEVKRQVDPINEKLDETQDVLRLIKRRVGA